MIVNDTYIAVGIRVLLKRAIAKGLRGDDKRTALLFTELATESLLEFAKGTFRREVEMECAHWMNAAARKRAQALSMTLGDLDRRHGKALAEADLMNRQAYMTLALLEK